MSRDKQIDIPESEMGMSGYTKLAWELWHKANLPMVKCVEVDNIMREQGYRKSQDVAEEIFAEIEKRGRKVQSSDFSGEFWSRGVLMSDLAELKKKYESEKDNG